MVTCNDMIFCVELGGISRAGREKEGKERRNQALPAGVADPGHIAHSCQAGPLEIAQNGWAD